MAGTNLYRVPTSTGNRKTFTISVWVKRSKISTNQKIFEASPDGSNRTEITFKTSDELQFYAEVGGVQKYNLKSNAKLRDTNGFYHIVCSVDTTQATNSNRVRMYINGEQITSLGLEVYPDQNFDTLVNLSSQINVIGRRNPFSDFYFDGSMSHFHLTDGEAYNASYFGETDATTGEWKIKTSPSVTYGTNGFFILKDGNSVTDQSGQGNNLLVGNGTLTKTEDCPSNVFATLNSLEDYYQATTLSNGNTTLVGGGSYAPNTGTIGLNTGKYYWETKVSDWQGSNGSAIGVSSESATAGNYEYYNQGGTSQGYGYFSNGSVYGGASLATGYGTAAGTHYIGVALDLDNNKIAWSYDGAWQGSANPSNGTNMLSITAPSSLKTGFYFPAFTQKDETKTFNVNFGNGYFGTTAVASAGTNASGNGIFEYDVPTGFTAISTKGLNL